MVSHQPKYTKVYLAGPMRGIPEFNFPAFFDAEDYLRSKGFDVINPARLDKEAGWDNINSSDADAQAGIRDFARRDVMAMLDQCGGIVLMDGWTRSSGARFEYALACFCGMKLYRLHQQHNGEGNSLLCLPKDFFERELMNTIALQQKSPTATSLYPEEALRSDVQAPYFHKIQPGEGLVEVDGPDPNKQYFERADQNEGLRYDTGKPKWHLVPMHLLEGMVKVLEFGAQKYDDHNWRKGMAYSKITNSLQRHLNAWNSGENIDPESGLHHVDHILCNAMFLSGAIREFEGKHDDRYKG